jgi:hypothetical protein
MLKESAPWAAGLARARLAAVSASRGQRDAALGQLRSAVDELEAAGLGAHASATRLRIAALEGIALERTPAWADLIARGVKRPERWLAVYAPWRSLSSG